MAEIYMPAEMSAGARLKRAVIALLITGVALVVTKLLLPATAMLWVKAFHIIAVISWMAGMLYLPRLFVNHAEVGFGNETSERFKMMERRLLEYIINPAMIASWVLGLWLAWEVYAFKGGWLHVKLVLVLVLSGVHGYLSGAVRRFGSDTMQKPPRHWRIINEIPTVLMIAIVILVVVRPF